LDRYTFDKTYFLFNLHLGYDTRSPAQKENITNNTAELFDIIAQAGLTGHC